MIDPYTGLDLAAYEQTEYQIPLASNPMLAPEWEPKGRYTDVLHPDNIPTFFGTLQAYNNESPKNVQALSTDGNKNLNVNIAAGGGGGGSALSRIDMPIDGIQGTFYSKYLTPGDEILRLYNTSDTYAMIGFSATAVIDPAGSHPDNSYALFYFELNESGPDDRWLLSGTLSHAVGPYKATQSTWSGNFIFPFPIFPPNGTWYNWVISLGWEGALDFEVAAQAQFASIS